MNCKILYSNIDLMDKNFLQYIQQIYALNYLLKKELISTSVFEKSSVLIENRYNRKKN